MQSIVLCYHKVGPEGEEGRRLNISPARLESHIRFYARRNRPFVTAKHYAQGFPNGSVCFTFDDAYESALKYAVPIFERYEKRATFFVVSDLIGKTSEWDKDLARPLANLESLIEAQRMGHEMANHTRSHPHLSQLSFEEQRQQIQQAHVDLASLGIQSESFCYPYGSYNNVTLEVLKSLNYQVGISLRKGLAKPTDDRLLIPRVVVAFSDSLPMLIYKTTLRQKLRR